MQVKQKYFSSDTYDRYTFDLSNQDPFFDKTVKEGKTDEQGKARVGFSIPSAYRQSGLLQANMYTTVFDETGRPVSRNTTVDINTQDVYFGIGTDGYDYYALQQPVRFPLIALKQDGKPTQATARVQIIKQDYRTILNRSDGYFRYASQKEDRILKDEEVPVSGTQSFYSFTPKIPGNYDIRVFIPGATTYVSRSFYSYGSWGSDANAFEVNPEGSIDIETDKKIYQVGEKAKVLFKTPFSGRLLVTVENEGLIILAICSGNQQKCFCRITFSGSTPSKCVHYRNFIQTAWFVGATTHCRPWISVGKSRIKRTKTGCKNKSSYSKPQQDQAADHRAISSGLNGHSGCSG